MRGTGSTKDVPLNSLHSGGKLKQARKEVAKQFRAARNQRFADIAIPVDGLVVWPDSVNPMPSQYMISSEYLLVERYASTSCLAHGQNSDDVGDDDFSCNGVVLHVSPDSRVTLNYLNEQLEDRWDERRVPAQDGPITTTGNWNGPRFNKMSRRWVWVLFPVATSPQ
jgi:hypothetical protein